MGKCFTRTPYSRALLSVQGTGGVGKLVGSGPVEDLRGEREEVDNNRYCLCIRI